MLRRSFAGFEVVVENPRGSMRQWYDRDAQLTGQTEMLNDYGFLDGHIGTDGDEVDCYLGDHEDAPFVFVVHQLKAPEYERHDEDKCFIGFRDETEAREAFENHRNDGSRAYGGMSAIPVEKFRAKLERRTGAGKIRHEASLAAVNFEIVKRADGYHVLSENGKHLGGPYDSRSAAEGRLRQVEIHKHMDSSGRPQTIASSVRFDAGDAGGGQVRTGVWDRICVPGENIKDGERTEFNAETCGQMVANFGDRGDPVMIDWNHQSSYAHSNGQPAPALGFYGALAAIFGGQVTSCEYAGGVDQIAPPATLEDGLWGLRTDVTPKGHELLPGFKLLSPTFTPEGVNQLGEPIGYCLLAVAATNTPWQAGTRITFEGGAQTFGALSEGSYYQMPDGTTWECKSSGPVIEMKNLRTGALKQFSPGDPSLWTLKEIQHPLMEFGASPDSVKPGDKIRVNSQWYTVTNVSPSSGAQVRENGRGFFVEWNNIDEVKKMDRGAKGFEQTFAGVDPSTLKDGDRVRAVLTTGEHVEGVIDGKLGTMPTLRRSTGEVHVLYPRDLVERMERDSQTFGAYGDVKVGDTVEGNGPDGYFEGKVLEMFRASDGEYVKVQTVAGPRNFKKSDAKIRGYQAFASILETLWWKVYTDRSPGGTFVQAGDEEQAKQKAERDGHGKATRAEPAKAMEAKMAVTMAGYQYGMCPSCRKYVEVEGSPAKLKDHNRDGTVTAKFEGDCQGSGATPIGGEVHGMETTMARGSTADITKGDYVQDRAGKWIQVTQGGPDLACGVDSAGEYREIQLPDIADVVKAKPLDFSITMATEGDLKVGDRVTNGGNEAEVIKVPGNFPGTANIRYKGGSLDGVISAIRVEHLIKMEGIAVTMGSARVLGPVTREEASRWLSSHGFSPVGGSSRYQDAKGNTGRIQDTGGQGDTWYVEIEDAAKYSVSMDLVSDLITQTERGAEMVKRDFPKWTSQIDQMIRELKSSPSAGHAQAVLSTLKDLAEGHDYQRGGVNRLLGVNMILRGAGLVSMATGLKVGDRVSYPGMKDEGTVTEVRPSDGNNNNITFKGDKGTHYVNESHLLKMDNGLTAASRGKGARHMSIANAARVVGLEPTANPKDVRRAFVQHFEDEAKKAAMEEGYDYSKHAGNLEEMAKAYEDAKFEEEEGGDPGEAPHVVMRKMATHFRKLGKMAAGDPPFGGKETPEEEAAEEAAGGHQLEEGDEEKKEAMTAMAKRLGLPARASLRQISMAMEARTTSLDKVGKLEGRIAEMEAQRATEVRNERVRSAFITFDNAVAQGRTKPEKRDVFIAAYQRNPKDAEGLLFAPGTFASKEILMHRMTAGGAPLGVDPRDAGSASAVDQRHVTMSALGGARGIVFGENLSGVVSAMADSDDPKVRARIDRELPEGVKGTKFESYERYIAADKIVRKDRPDLARAADPNL